MTLYAIFAPRRYLRRYFDIACRRIEEAQRQADLFIPRPPAPKQEPLAL
jgi:hypothetical protein